MLPNVRINPEWIFKKNPYHCRFWLKLSKKWRIFAELYRIFQKFVLKRSASGHLLVVHHWTWLPTAQQKARATLEVKPKSAAGLQAGTDYGTYSEAQPDDAAKNIMFASMNSQQTCYEYVSRQSCIAVECTKNCRFSKQTQRHSLLQNAGSAQLRAAVCATSIFFQTLEHHVPGCRGACAAEHVR